MIGIPEQLMGVIILFSGMIMPAIALMFFIAASITEDQKEKFFGYLLTILCIIYIFCTFYFLQKQEKEIKGIKEEIASSKIVQYYRKTGKHSHTYDEKLLVKTKDNAYFVDTICQDSKFIQKNENFQILIIFNILRSESSMSHDSFVCTGE